MLERFAKLSLSTIARIGDLTKRELQIYIYLTACRNHKTGRCDPSRTTIAAGLGVGYNDVWEGVKGLDRKGWIRIDGEGFEIVAGDAIPAADHFRKTEQTTSGKRNVPENGSSGKRNQNFRNTEVELPENGSDVIITIEQKKEQKNNNNVGDTPTAGKDDATKVFEYWKTVCGKNGRTTFTDKRRRNVVARLKKYSVKDIFDAIEGCRRSPHHAGLNDTGTVYDDLELICRTETHLERFIEYNERGPVRKRDRNADVGRPRSDSAAIGYNVNCPHCAGTCWTDAIPETVDRSKYTGEKFPCPECSTESFEYCIQNYKLAA